MSAGEWGVTLIVAALLARGLFRAWAGHQRRWRLSEWAREAGLELTPRNEGFVRSYIARTRLLRIAGGATGFVAPIVYSAYTDQPPPPPFDFSLATGLGGYLLGAVLAELTVRRPKTEQPTALLVPRDLRDYLPSFHTLSLRLAATVALVLYLIYFVIARSSANELVEPLPSPIVMVSMIVVILVGVEMLQRFIVGRPQPAMDSDLVRADDAVRSASVHALAGAGIALEILIACVGVFGIGIISDIRGVRWTLPWIAVLGLGVALGAWTDLTQPRHWKVQHAQERAGT